MESIRGHGHLAHRIFFDSRRFFRHAERSAPTPARRERLFDFVEVRPAPCADRCFVKHRDKHWRDILQKIFRFVALENGGVLPQLISDLVNDKLAVRLKGIVGLSQQCALLLDLENAERNSGENVIARSESTAFQLVRQRGRIAMNHVHASIACKLPFECSCQRRVEFKQEQMRIRCHPSRDLPRVHTFARAVLRDDARLAEIHFAGDTFHHRLRAGYNRRDLEWTLQKTLEKKCAHGNSDVRLRHSGCLVLMSQVISTVWLD